MGHPYHTFGPLNLPKKNLLQKKNASSNKTRSHCPGWVILELAVFFWRSFFFWKIEGAESVIGVPQNTCPPSGPQLSKAMGGMGGIRWGTGEVVTVAHGS